MVFVWDFFMRRKWLIIAIIAVFFGGMASGALLDYFETSGTPEPSVVEESPKEPESPIETSHPKEEVAKLKVPIASRPTNAPTSVAPEEIEVPLTSAPKKKGVLAQITGITATISHNTAKASRLAAWQKIVITTALTLVAGAILIFGIKVAIKP